MSRNAAADPRRPQLQLRHLRQPRLDGGEVPLAPLIDQQPFPTPPPREGTAKQIAAGEVLYNRYCGRCHQLGRSLLPDLRALGPSLHQAFYQIVLEGALASYGMARWDDVLSHTDAEAIHAYLVSEAWKEFEARHATP